MKICYLLLVGMLLPFFSKGEGTKQLRPREDVNGHLHLRPGDESYTNFGLYGANPEEQIKITITSTDETLYYGLNNNDGAQAGNTGFIYNIPYRILDPDGKVVYDSEMPGPGEEGHINDWDEAVAGPAEVTGAGGYDAIEFNPAKTGDYVIEFDPDYREFVDIHLFDFTVVDAGGEVQSGRLHSQGWQISTEAYDNPFEGTLYPYDPEGALYEVDFNGIQPYLFVVNFNSTGLENTGDFVSDRTSRIGNHTYPQYEVFLTPPPEELYPTQLREVNFNGEVVRQDCQGTEYCLNFTSNTPGYIDGFLDFNGNDIYEPELNEVFFATELEESGTQCIEWDGRDADGNLVETEEVQVVASFGYGATHLPLFDVEHNRNGFRVKVVRPEESPDPDVYWDDSDLHKGTAIDPRLNLTGCLSSSSGCHRWENRGEINGLNINAETINTWWYATVVQDTMLFTNRNFEAVQLSFEPDALVQDEPLVCSGDTVPFFIYNDGISHYDESEYTYEWFFNGSSFGSNTRDTSRQVTDTSEVVVVATDRENSACFTSDTIVVNTVDPIELSAVIEDADCWGPGSITVTVESGPPDPVFHWEEYPSVSSGTLSDVSAGAYHVYVEDPAFSSRCAGEESYTVDRIIEEFDIENLQVTASDCGRPTGAAEITMPADGLGYVFSWDNEGFTSDNLVSELSVGEHDIRVRVPGNDCMTDTSFFVPGNGFSYDVFSADDTCSSGEGRIEVTSYSQDVTITWDDTASTSFDRREVLAGNYSFTLGNVHDASCRARGTAEVGTITDSIDTDFSYTVLSGGGGVPEAFEDVQFYNESEDRAVYFSWSFGDGNTSGEENPVHYYDEGTEYIVTLEVEDEKGCKGRAARPLRVDKRPECDPAMPNAFSPNGDNINEDIGVLGHAEDVELKIFNRWGEVIFRGFSLKERWDGTYRGRQVPVGVYPFKVTYECLVGKDKTVVKEQVGQITLIR